LNGSIGYLPALGALAVFASLLWTASGSQPPQRRQTARGLAIAALIFTISLTFRTIDRDVCDMFPFGAHFLWHMLNALVLWLLLRTAILAKAAVEPAA
jgi:hypothetical protein